MKQKVAFIIIGLLFSFFTAQSQITFGPPHVIISDHWGGLGAVSVYAADIDGDGDMDVLSASNEDAILAWHENTDGNGNFHKYQVIAVDLNNPSSIYAADFDGDGDMDVLSGSLTENEVAWFINTDGKGTFGPKQLITQYDMKRITSVFAADIDGDGDMDALAASYDDGKLAWFENLDGNGTFSSPRFISTNAVTANSVYATDIDGDGDMDVMTALKTMNTIAWYENMDGAGSFSSIKPITDEAIKTESATAADIDGDGDMDVIWACTGNWPASENSKIAWCENVDGNGTFSTSRIFLPM